MPLRPPAAGDIVVTKVANHYHVGRVQPAGKPLATIAPAMDRRSDALALACGLVTGSQRVFLYAHSDQRARVDTDCTNPHWPREI